MREESLKPFMGLCPHGSRFPLTATEVHELVDRCVRESMSWLSKGFHDARVLLGLLDNTGQSLEYVWRTDESNQVHGAPVSRRDESTFLFGQVIEKRSTVIVYPEERIPKDLSVEQWLPEVSRLRNCQVLPSTVDLCPKPGE